MNFAKCSIYSQDRLNKSVPIKVQIWNIIYICKFDFESGTRFSNF